MALSYLKVNFSKEGVLRLLDDAARGQLFLAIMEYAQHGEVKTELSREAAFVFPLFREEIDAAREKHTQRAKVNAQNGLKGGRPATRKQVLSETENNPIGFSETEVNPIGLIAPHNQDQSQYYKESESGANAPVRSRSKRFVPPSEDELRAFCRETSLDASEIPRFMDFYTSNGWRVGNNPMKEWKPAYRNWLRKAGQFSAAPRAAPTPPMKNDVADIETMYDRNGEHWGGSA